MSQVTRLLAFDLGAESGRAILGTFSEGKVELKEIHRFPTQGLTMLGVRQWDLTRIYEDFIKALTLYANEYGPTLDGIGIDTWGVDFGLIDADGVPVGNPVHYRDKRTEGVQKYCYGQVPESEIYDRTGIVSHPFNTIYQLLAMVKDDSAQLKAGKEMLFMGNLLEYLLCGVKNCEWTITSTGQLADPRTGDWDQELIKKLGLPGEMLLKPEAPGRVVGALLPEVAAQTGLDPATPVISVAIHDTASAVVSVPVIDDGKPWAYLSSGTWSLLGAELPEPKITPEAMAARFTNEGGVENTTRFLKNIFGLWLVQESRRAWVREAGGDETGLSYAELVKEAEASEPFRSLLAIEDPRLMAPDNMVETIQAICSETGQPVPETRGQVLRCCFESLALCYRDTIADMDALLGRKTERLHIIGGGVQNKFLCQMTANACGIPVLGGPIEATALGNLVVQAMAKGVVDSMAAGREVIRNSFDLEAYEPQATETWADKILPKA